MFSLILNWMWNIFRQNVVQQKLRPQMSCRRRIILCLESFHSNAKPDIKFMLKHYITLNCKVNSFRKIRSGYLTTLK